MAWNDSFPSLLFKLTQQQNYLKQILGKKCIKRSQKESINTQTHICTHTHTHTHTYAHTQRKK